MLRSRALGIGLLIVVAAVMPLAGNMGLQQAAGASIDNSLNGNIFYVKEGEQLSITFQYSGDLEWSELPEGADVDLGTPGRATLSWTPQSVLEAEDLAAADTSSLPSAAIGIMFNASDVTGFVTADIMIQVLSSDVPDPGMELDKPTYIVGDNVVATIKDPYALCDFGPEPTSPRVSAAHDLSIFPTTGVPIPLTNVIELDPSGSDLIARFQLDSALVTSLAAGQPNIDARLQYDRPDCPDGLPGIGGSTWTTLQIRSVEISLDRSQYAWGMTPHVTVNPASVVPPSAEIFDSESDTAGDPVDVVTSPGGGYNILIPSSGSDREILRLTYQYSVGAFSFSTHTDAVLLTKNLVTDKETYYSNDAVILNFTDPIKNTDRDKAEGYGVTYTSTASGFFDSGPLDHFYVNETGKDTGIFVNDVYLFFRGAGDPIPPGSSIPIDRTKTTTVVITIEGQPSKPITVVPFELEGSPGGTGSNNENFPLGRAYSKSGLNPLQLYTCASFGGDSDGDGLCNNWEAGGSGGTLRIPYEGTTYTVATCSQPSLAGCFKNNHKDILLEVDYVHSVTPSAVTTALDSIRSVLNTAPITNGDGINGIKLHYVVNEDIGSNTWQKDVKVWTGGDSYPTTNSNNFDIIKYYWFGTSTERVGGAPSYATFAKMQAAHYVLITETQNNNAGSSGVAEQDGNDVIVSLKLFDTDGTIDNVDYIRGTIMHELGHNLGLYHGGPSSTQGYNVNCKPNYPSVMTYARQLTTAYGTQRYSDDINDPNPINIAASQLYDANVGANPPNEVLTLGAQSALSSITIVWSYDAGVHKPTASVTKTSGTINWAGDADPPSEVPNTSRIDIADLGFAGCSWATNNHLDQLYGADDYLGMILNFRETNTATAGSGGFLPDQEFNSTMATDFRVAGIESLNYLIQSIPPMDFRAPYDSEPVANQIKDDISKILIEASPNATTFIIDNNISPNKSVVDLINEGNFTTAASKLTALREYMDDEDGGSIVKDLFSSTTAYQPRDPPAEPVFNWFFNNNIASLKAGPLDMPWENSLANPGTEQSFKVVTFDRDCEAWHAHNITLYDKNCVIDGTALTIINGTDTFASNNNLLKLVLVGEGNALFSIPTYQLNRTDFVVADGYETSASFEQKMNSDSWALNVTGLPYYPNLVTIGHDLRNITASGPQITQINGCEGNYAAYIRSPGQTLNLTSMLHSNRIYDQEFEMTIELTPWGKPGGGFVAGSVTGTLGALQTECISITFTPPPNYAMYTATVTVRAPNSPIELADSQTSYLLINSIDP